jgi:hypothetical protein
MDTFMHQLITVNKYLTYIVYHRGVMQLFKDIYFVFAYQLIVGIGCWSLLTSGLTRETT